MSGTLQDLRCLVRGILWVRDIRPKHRAECPEKEKIAVGKKIEFLSQLSCWLISHNAAGGAITPDKPGPVAGASKIGPNIRPKKPLQ